MVAKCLQIMLRKPFADNKVDICLIFLAVKFRLECTSVEVYRDSSSFCYAWMVRRESLYKCAVIVGKGM